MISKEAIEKIQQAVAIENAAREIRASMEHSHTEPVALPAEMKLHDLQQYMPSRRRLSGTMNTDNPDSFAAYCNENADINPSVFVNGDAMAATAVLNFGTAETPGHADNRATLQFKQTAQMHALLKVANADTISQRKLAEWLEDHAPFITCFAGDDALKLPQAVAAVRNVSIEQISKSESTVEQLSAERTAFEQIKASSKHQLPTLIYFRCTPYIGLPERLFVSRLGVHTGNSEPRITLRIINWEQHQQEMADDAGALIAKALPPEFSVFSGEYIVSR